MKELWELILDLKADKKREEKRQQRRMGKSYTSFESVVLITVVQGKKRASNK